MVDTAWDGRCWVTASIKRLTPQRSFRFISYHVLADYKCNFIYYSTARNWDFRRETQLNEILSYRPDVLCLQDVDHYKDWWQPQLIERGYDTIFQLRTQEKDFHYEGVLIAYRSDMFQLFKTVYLQFNDAVQTDERGSYFREMSRTDDVGIIAMLQPLSESCVRSAICVTTAMFSDVASHGEVRMAQTEYLTRQIELCNQEFHLPVVLGLCMNDVPSSLAYTVLQSGRTPLAGQVPKKCPKLYGIPTSRGSLLLKWLPPKTTLADPPLLGFRIAFRPGGSNILGFQSKIEVTVGDCVRYAEQVDEHRNVRMVAVEEREFTITGLCSDVPYEFKIAAVNEVGEGVWSEPCDPVVLNNPGNAPEMPELQTLLNLEQLKMQREEIGMRKGDWNVQLARRTDAVAAETQLTPRLVDGEINSLIPRGRVLPVEVNPRNGWKATLHGQPDPAVSKAMSQEIVVLKSVLRDKQGYIRRDLNAYNEDISRRYNEPDQYVTAANTTIATIAAAATAAAEAADALVAAGVWEEDLNDGDNLQQESAATLPSTDFDGGSIQQLQRRNSSSHQQRSGAYDTAKNLDEEDEDYDDFFLENKTANGMTISSADSGRNRFTQSEGRGMSLVQRQQQPQQDEEEIEDNEYTLYRRFEERHTEVMNRLVRRRLRVLQDALLRERDLGGVLIDGREVLDSIGVPNRRQVHNLQLRSVYAGYSSGGEPLYTQSAPKERNRLGTDCVDYIFYSAGALSLRALLSIPCLTQLREGASPQDPCAVAHEHHSKPFHIAEQSFNAPLKQLFDSLHMSVDGDLLSSTDDPNNIKMVSRSKVEDAKRILRRALTASQTAGIHTKKTFGSGNHSSSYISSSSSGSSSSNGSSVGSALWGGKWSAFPTPNHQRRNFYLPNDVFASSHMALGADFELNEQFLATQWS